MTHLTNRSTAAPVNLKRGFNIHLLVFLLAIPALWLVWFVTNNTYLWPIWNTTAWGTGLLFHYLGVYVFKKNKNN